MEIEIEIFPSITALQRGMDDVWCLVTLSILPQLIFSTDFGKLIWDIIHLRSPSLPVECTHFITIIHPRVFFNGHFQNGDSFSQIKAVKSKKRPFSHIALLFWQLNGMYPRQISNLLEIAIQLLVTGDKEKVKKTDRA